jgi:hypothetical protein
LIDASKEEVIGSALLPAQMLLQYQRDRQATSSIISFLKSLLSLSPTSTELIQMNLKLREVVSGNKNIDWFPLIKSPDQLQTFGK